jgi:DNA-directed RNA polymerase subunit RPC12/RpoP
MPTLPSAVVFPPEILAMEVKFLCTSCQSRLGADARWEGRGVICPVCGDKTRVPRWSGIMRGQPRADFAQGAKAAAFSDGKLSSDEIAFLSEPAPTTPGAGA